MPAHDITVREAATSDAAMIAEFNALLAFESEGKRLDRITLQAGVDKGLARPELCRYYVAEASAVSSAEPIQKEVVGQAMVSYEWSDWRAATFWWIQSVFVRPEFRGRGVFRALFRHIENQARRNPEVCGVRLYVEKGNRSAIATYKRLGLKPSGHVIYEMDWSAPGTLPARRDRGAPGA